MQTRIIRRLALALFASFSLSIFIPASQSQKSGSDFSPSIPKTWDDEAMTSFELPLAYPKASSKHISSDYYYRLPERVIYKSYPVYAPGKEPPGYFEWLKQQEPEILFDAAKLRAEADWVKAGEIVFDAPIEYDRALKVADVRDPVFYEKLRVPVTKDSVMPFASYVIREKGKVELGNLSCGMCHTRVMADGTIIKGAQSNFPLEPAIAFSFWSKVPEPVFRRILRQFLAAPWVNNDPHARLDQMSREEIIEAIYALPPGVIPRQGTSLLYPPQVPDLIGVKDRRYLDNTGLHRHRSIGDLMRYAALNQILDVLNRYGDFIPAGDQSGALPPPGKALFIGTNGRYSDAQLYALALYLYSLKPPPNPNKYDALAQRGEKIFQREGCATCHTPPLHTNNKLTPAEGFAPPPDHLKKYDILPISVGTDPKLAMTTRRGTGYYKVPSLKGVWYRGPFEHNGSVATLEDWFDPRRLRDDYVPTGFKGGGVKTRAIKGHEFGLELSLEDKKALIALLKTL